jgi:hypothetical protein
MGDKQPRDLGGGGAFEVPGEAAASAEPCKCAFDDPAPRQEFEPFDAGRPLNNFDRPRSTMGERVDKLFATINPVSEDVAQLGEAVSQALQQRDCPMDVLHIGGMDVDGQQKAVGISHDMPLAPVDALARVKTARPAGLCRRSTLAVDDRSRRSRLTTEFPPRFSDQGPDDPVPPGGVPPGVEIALDRRVWGEVAWQSPPLAAGRDNEQNCVYHPTQIYCPRPAAPAPRRHLARNQPPLRIGHIACVTQTITLILPAGDFGPWHRALPRIFANPKESQPAEITHFFFSQALRMRSEFAAES